MGFAVVPRLQPGGSGAGQQREADGGHALPRPRHHHRPQLRQLLLRRPQLPRNIQVIEKEVGLVLVFMSHSSLWSVLEQLYSSTY